MSPASVRILRLALGTSLALWLSQAYAWDMSFIAPVLALFLLSLPLPAPTFAKGAGFVVVLFASLCAGLLLLPFIMYYRWAGVLLLGLALFWTFYFTARGGSAVLGTLATVGIALATAVGTVSIDAVLAAIKGVGFGAVVALLFVWIAHALLPDSLAGRPQGPAPPRPAAAAEPDPVEARQSALRSLAIVLPVALWFLLSSASSAYAPVMIKVASMGQQATNEGTRQAGRSLILSTLIGGVGAIIGWQVLQIYPSLSIYALLVALAALMMGGRIFEGAGMHPQAATWSYAYLTMIVILAPAVLDSATGAAAGVKFVDRLVMFAGATLYAVAAVYVVDAFSASARRRPGRAEVS